MEATSDGGAGAVSARRKGRGPLRTALRIALAGAGAILLLLVGLTLLYRFVTPPSTLMLARWATGESVDRRAVPLAAMGRVLPHIVIASEDARFCTHRGVDWEILAQVVEKAIENEGGTRGASTIAMQTAKNLFLWPDRSYVRKAMEIPLALWLDFAWPKRRVLEVYLNIAEWGDGIFGIEAAAQRHFGKSARDLTRREAALLATALPNPLRRDPGRAGPGHRRLAAALSARAAREGPIDGCLRP